MKPTIELAKEHVPIRLALRILLRLAGQDLDDPDSWTGHADQLIIFIRDYADKLHHGKEEDLFFPAVQRSGTADEAALIRELVSEHGIGRELVKCMAAAVSGRSAADFRASAAKYAALLDQHIDKENIRLFPMADRSLSQEEQESLEQGFRDFEAEAFSKNRLEELLAIFENLKSTYLKAST